MGVYPALFITWLCYMYMAVLWALALWAPYHALYAIPRAIDSDACHCGSLYLKLYM